jgi:hypothetical protein
LALIALAALATVLVIILGLTGAPRPIEDRSSRQSSRPSAASPHDRDAAINRLRPVVAEEPAIVVRTDGDNQAGSAKPFPADRLREAMELAMGGGWVELRSTETFRLSAGQTFDFASARGRLIVRAAPGVVPVVDIELSADKPLLVTGSAVYLVLSGVEFRLRYPRPSGGSPRPSPPLFKLAGATHIERCAVRVVDRHRSFNSCALLVDGSNLEVDRCWFQGFDTAIKIEAYRGTVVVIRQTMIVPDPERELSRLPIGSRGWGVAVHLAPGGKGSEARLMLEHCTIEGTGLLDLVSASVRSSLQVEVKRCAARTDSLLAWKPAKPGDRLDAQLRWQGEGNQLQILGHPWIVAPTALGTAAIATVVSDLESWCKAVGQESEPVRNKLVFRLDGASPTNPLLRPQDFAIDGVDFTAKKVGADPEQVGPWDR